jgi:hypothetical protein
MMPGPAAGGEPRWDRGRRIARPGTARVLPGLRARADPAEAGYLEDVGRPEDGPARGSAASTHPAPPAPPAHRAS